MRYPAKPRLKQVLAGQHLAGFVDFSSDLFGRELDFSCTGEPIAYFSRIISRQEWNSRPTITKVITGHDQTISQNRKISVADISKMFLSVRYV
jgi:hypothetical protein